MKPSRLPAGEGPPPPSGLQEQYRPTLRPVRETDATAIFSALQDPELLQWLAALPKPLDSASFERYMSFLLDPDVSACAICLEDQLAGVVSLGAELSFWVQKEFRSRGAGGWAVSQFLSRLPKECKGIDACCLTSNLAAADFLTKHGFRKSGVPFKRFSFPHQAAREFQRFRQR